MLVLTYEDPCFSLEGLIFLLDSDLVAAKRRRLRKAADVRGATTTAVEGPVVPSAGEAAEPVVTDATEPAADEAARPVAEWLEEETVERAPSPPRPAVLPEQQEKTTTETAASGAPAGEGADVEMEENVPLPPPPNAEPVEAAACSEAAAGAAAAEPTTARPPSPAPEARVEALLESGGAGDHVTHGGEGSLQSPRARVDPGPSAEPCP